MPWNSKYILPVSPQPQPLCLWVGPRTLPLFECSIPWSRYDLTLICAFSVATTFLYTVFPLYYILYILYVQHINMYIPYISFYFFYVQSYCLLYFHGTVWFIPSFLLVKSVYIMIFHHSFIDSQYTVLP